ncbi:hypothetical protein M413DRAFT_239949 [Hebeloma cylindrosporum]|uniref:Uncharacterized protein n=1 Tax=Hebeloma cylindrosporum TaxID=76867 RepID=A0A0C3C2Z9_HEBCY|nr:hypothetical protein M413DRAFT_239949 [Hebeloma cylindrosporum h7]
MEAATFYSQAEHVLRCSPVLLLHPTSGSWYFRRPLTVRSISLTPSHSKPRKYPMASDANLGGKHGGTGWEKESLEYAENLSLDVYSPVPRRLSYPPLGIRLRVVPQGSARFISSCSLLSFNAWDN